MRATTLMRRGAAAFLAVILSLGAAACGDEGGSSAEEAELVELSADELYPAILAALQDAGTFAIETTVTDEESSMTMRGDARLDGDTVEMALTADGDDPADMIAVDGKLYMKAESLEVGDKWVDMTPYMDLFADFAKQTSPDAMFAPVEEPVDLELVGEEEIDGTPTNHYRVTVATADVLESGGAMIDMADMFPEEMVVEIWVDADDRPLKQEYSLEMKTLMGEEGETEEVNTTVMELSDFGKDVDIEAPDPDEISDVDPFEGLADGS